MKKNFLMAIFLALFLHAADCNAQAPFYQDKNITLVLGGPPSGSADLRTRVGENKGKLGTDPAGVSLIDVG